MAITWQWECFSEVDSTNRLAGQRVREQWNRGEPAEGLILVAQRQTAGRGQHARRWESPDGGLYFSAIIENVPEPVRPRLALLAGVSVVDGLQSAESYFEEERARAEHWHVQAALRWPNDVLLGRKKVAGVLCEAAAQGEKWAGVIGVGINVLTDIQALPSGLHSTATSLLAHDGRLRTLTGVGHAVLAALAQWIEKIQTQGLAPIVSRVRELDCLRGRHVQFDAGQGAFDAVAEGIDDAGRLLLRQGEGRIEPFERGSVVAVFPAI